MISGLTWYILASAWDLVAITAVVGILVARLAILKGEADQTQTLQALLGVGLLALSTATLVILVSRSLEMSGMGLAQLGALLGPVLTQTRFGTLWLVRAGALVLLWLLWAFVGPRAWRDYCMLGLVALIALVRAATGHAGDHGLSWTLLVNAIHLLAISVWTGALLILSLAVFPRLATPSADGLLTAVRFERLSRVSGWALAVILATGVFLADRALGRWSALWDTDYGRVLSTKLVIVSLMTAIGAHNRYIKRPRLWYAIRHPGPQWRHHWQTASCAVAFEAGLGLVALLLAATLLHGMPPRTMGPMPDTSRARPTANPPVAAAPVFSPHQVIAYGSS